MRRRSLLVLPIAVAFVVSSCAGVASPSPTSQASAAASSAPSPSPSASASAAASGGPLMAKKPTDCPLPDKTTPVTITMWSNTEAPGQAVEEAMIGEWKAANPNVTFNYTGGMDLFDSFDKFQAAAPAGSGPTIYGAYMPWIPILKENNLLAPAVPAAM